MNDVRAENEQLLESANELRTINEPLLQLMNELYSSKELHTISQRCLLLMNQLRTFKPLVNSDRYQKIIIIIWFPPYNTSDSLIESQRQLSFAKSINNSF